MSPSQRSTDPGTGPAEVTRLLREAAEGRRESFDRLMPLVYAELKGLARARLASQREGHSLRRRSSTRPT